jgi:hypothetical protein
MITGAPRRELIAHDALLRRRTRALRGFSRGSPRPRPGYVGAGASTTYAPSCGRRSRLKRPAHKTPPWGQLGSRPRCHERPNPTRSRCRSFHSRRALTYGVQVLIARLAASWSGAKFGATTQKRGHRGLSSGEFSGSPADPRGERVDHRGKSHQYRCDFHDPPVDLAGAPAKRRRRPDCRVQPEAHDSGDTSLEAQPEARLGSGALQSGWSPAVAAGQVAPSLQLARRKAGRSPGGRRPRAICERCGKGDPGGPVVSLASHGGSESGCPEVARLRGNWRQLAGIGGG